MTEVITMTIEEFYKWAVKNDCEDKQVVIYARDNIGNEVENWLTEGKERVSIDCIWE